ncbi:hypothetical protein [Roseivirga echinicomitans]|uniref:Outer membrane protein beta-barrel domain-containing protein n=1 Tax=Roseivirga echinicomitans TaxID=296218 RepID=A0A150XVQ0_9BACT|nr:hypothetical protein [Roseivirga echinicomitans]KYG82820.1 hypothetical protein AWN68_13620 [Roseivirga echinicomitans]
MSDFENGLKEMFDGAEFKPSDRVWAGVQAGLKAKKKKGVFFYWQTYGIAAGIVLVLSFGFLFSDRFNGGEGKVTTENKAEFENKVSDNGADKEKSTDADGILAPVDNTPANRINDQLDNGVNAKLQAANTKQNSDAFSKQAVSLRGENEVLPISIIEMDNEHFDHAKPRTPQRSINILKGLWDMKHMVASMELKDYKIERITTNETRALALNGGLNGGSFNPNPSRNSLDMLSRQDSPISNVAVLSSVSNGSDKQLSSMGFGAGLAFELNDRWGMNLGLRYSEYRFANQSNAYSVENGVSYPIYLPAGYAGEVFFIPNYNITNTIKSISIPIQASFKVLDLGRFDVQMKAGLSADYFLSYNVKGDLKSLEVRKVAFSRDGLFDRFNVAGLSALALNYKLSKEWGISAEGYYRKFLKQSSQEVSSQSGPSVLGVGFSLNYFLNRRED